MYANGAGVPQDHAEAAKRYRLAAEQGDAVGQYNLGQMYRLGEGVLQDIAHAYMSFSLAATNGDQKAIDNKKLVGSHMTPGQIAEAQRLAREWSRRRKDGASSTAILYPRWRSRPQPPHFPCQRSEKAVPWSDPKIVLR